jgi:diguanylate cyclase (GGDEF)-like protein
MLRNKNKRIGSESDEGTARGGSCARLLRKIQHLERELALARRCANYDSLTGLPNRSLMLDRLRQALSQAARQRKKVGLLLIDLDEFKKVNDDLGHSAGDAVLRDVATRLVNCIRECDTACRYGGDEFVILLPEIRGIAEVEAVKRKILEHLSKPHRLGGQPIVVGGSIGSAVFGREATSCQALIAAADAAMYRVKRLRLDARTMDAQERVIAI